MRYIPLKKINMKKEILINGKPSQTKTMRWRCNTPALLQEIAQRSREGGALAMPLAILGNILGEVGMRAAELNDPKLNAIMCRLSIYEIADQFNENSNMELANSIMENEPD